MQLLKTTTATCTRYFIDGKRVTYDSYDEAKFGKTLYSFVTRTAPNGTVRQWVNAR